MSARPVSFATLKTYTTRRDTTLLPIPSHIRPAAPRPYELPAHGLQVKILLVVLLITDAPSHKLEPPENPGRFKTVYRRHEALPRREKPLNIKGR